MLFLGAFIAGVLTTLAPCVLPLLPVIVGGSLGKPSAETRRRAYLIAASHVLGNDSFHYVKEVVTDKHAVLEFQCDLDGIVVNGVDIMTFDDQGKISEFKVMVRPLKAVNELHARMKAMLEQFAA